jgi:hypothetical protein
MRAFFAAMFASVLLLLGIVDVVVVLSVVWFGNWFENIAISLVISIFGFGALGAVSCVFDKNISLLGSVCVAIPTFLFALGCLGNIRDEPLEFVFLTIQSLVNFD